MKQSIVFGPFALLILFVWGYWMQHPDLTQMQIFMKWWWLWLLSGLWVVVGTWLVER